uniref:Uncharacterized protein n=1 Tax=Moniliophthora roreri TaxID=221103 RepID=A0A0W0G3B1_MONRR
MHARSYLGFLVVNVLRK